MADAEPPQKQPQVNIDAPAMPEVTTPPTEQPAETQDQVPAASTPRRPLKRWLFEKGIDAAGFGGVLKAWRAEGNRFRNVMKSIGTKAADMAAGRAVSTTMRLIAITWVAGMIGGVSTIGSVALLAVAAGVSSGIYSYHKDYLTARLRGPKEQRRQVKYLDMKRAKSAGLSFLSGTANGLFGAWLAKTGILQAVLGRVKDFIFSGGGLLQNSFNTAAAPALPLSAESRGASLSGSFAVAAADTRVAALPACAPVMALQPPAAATAPKLAA